MTEADAARPAQPDIAAQILRQVAARGGDKSICPSEVARALAPDPAWRGLMSRVRAVALGLARDGQIEILRKGKPVDPTQDVRGVIRLRIASGVDDA